MTNNTMNKKTIITALLALVAMTGQAQVRSGLDLCLRDETTGEWLIGLFESMPSTTVSIGSMPRRGKAAMC